MPQMLDVTPTLGVTPRPDLVPMLGLPPTPDLVQAPDLAPTSTLVPRSFDDSETGPT